MASNKVKLSIDDPKLPLEVRCIQRIQDFLPPKTTQDSVDTQAAEFATANLLRIHADKRYEAAKKSIIDAYGVAVAKVRNDATETMTKSSSTISGEDWSLTLSANKPATKVDVDELRTELVRAGFNVDKIDAAITKVTKKNTPALTIVAIRMPD